LDAFLGEISVEASERQSRPIDSWFSDTPLEAAGIALEFELQIFAMPPKESLDSNYRNIQTLSGDRTDRLDDRFCAHGCKPFYPDLSAIATRPPGGIVTINLKN
jgi:hypothetical protein